VSNDASRRFAVLRREEADDGWTGAPEEADRPPATVVGEDRGPGIITWNSSPDVPFDRSINPYKGCEHGCVYCFARPSHAYLELSPGLDFETKLFSKPDAAERLRAALGRPGYKPATLALGANTDPYQPVERRLEITRDVLKVLAEARHPVCIVTKSALVLRDLDLLVPLAKDGLARVMLSVTTLDRTLARRLEPRAPTPARRLAALRSLARAGVPCGVLAAPVIPALTDSELEAILQQAATAGADSAGYVLLRLPHEVRALFDAWLAAHYPDRREHVLSRVRQDRDGAHYDPAWGRRLTGAGVHADLLAQRFHKACRRLGLDTGGRNLDGSQFRPPARDARQMHLF